MLTPALQVPKVELTLNAQAVRFKRVKRAKSCETSAMRPGQVRTSRRANVHGCTVQRAGLGRALDCSSWLAGSYELQGDLPQRVGSNGGKHPQFHHSKNRPAPTSVGSSKHDGHPLQRCHGARRRTLAGRPREDLAHQRWCGGRRQPHLARLLLRSENFTSSPWRSPSPSSSPPPKQ